MTDQKNTPQRTWRQRVKALENVPRFLKIVWEAGPLLAFWGGVSRLLRALVPVASLYIGKLIIDFIVRALRTGHANQKNLEMMILASLILAIISDLLGRSGALAESLLTDRFTNRLSVQLIEHASQLDLVHFETPEFYDKLERARRQSASRIELTSTAMGTAQSCLAFFGLASALFVYYPWLLFMLVVAVIPVFVGETKYGALRYSLLYRLTPQRRELDYLRNLGASQESAKEIRLFGLGKYLAGRYHDTATRYYRENRKLAARRAITGFGLGLISTAAYYVAYVLILFRGIRGELSVGDVTLLAGSFSQSRSLLEGIVMSISDIFEQTLYLEDLFSFFRMQPRIRSREGAIAPPRPFRTGLEFRNVTFRYPGAQRDAVHRVNFRIEPGERVALIGSNGAGKTTVARLVARLYEPTEGQILLDGVDLREYRLDEWWGELSIIFQDFVRYNMRLSENIALGQIDHLEDQDRIIEAARRSGALAVASRLPKGLEQMIGPVFDKGINLSGGEWQKIALARAYMRDAQLLILDEPTAALDAEAEHEVFQRFVHLTTNKMALLISHRFSTVRMADRIVVLENGRVQEQGSHRELLASAGRYSELFELQAAGYR